MRVHDIITITLAMCCAACQPPPEDPGPRPEDFDDLPFGEEVDRATLTAAADAVAECIGEPYDPEALARWRVWTVERVIECVDGECFSCPKGVVGCESEEAECLCGGVADPAFKRIAVATDLRGLAHELQHALWKRDHDAPGFYECSEVWP